MYLCTHIIMHFIAQYKYFGKNFRFFHKNARRFLDYVFRVCYNKVFHYI